MLCAPPGLQPAPELRPPAGQLSRGHWQDSAGSALIAGVKFAISLMLLGFATPALAAGAAVPEPSAMALFGLGVLGVIVGRRSARGKRD
ncbi:hypothetical protein GCM10011515_16040 [Tsuneonella deserti]|uniref:Ice-binding protein C-terminal domain-containing protein n=1 Tax=Tsuneonella deserti TaxID=2035528 RepID=A0ABQ1S9R8_9SPHN|nr:hypothetical protein GCM10011515_16040 [Tsuneonella deserti]